MSNKSSYALVKLIPESRRLLTGVSPVTSRKAVKNAVEIAGMRRAHVSHRTFFFAFFILFASFSSCSFAYILAMIERASVDVLSILSIIY